MASTEYEIRASFYCHLIRELNVILCVTYVRESLFVCSGGIISEFFIFK